MDLSVGFSVFFFWSATVVVDLFVDFSVDFYFRALVSTPVDFVSGFLFNTVLRLKKIHLRNPQRVETSKSTGPPR